MTRDTVPPSAERPSTLKILVAEDNKVNRLILQTMLEKVGHDVIVACDGREAVEAASSQSFDVILMDVQMPEVDGLSATRTIRSMAGEIRNVPIIAVTANTTPEDRDACFAAGMDEFVTKPIKSGGLLAAIYDVMTRKKATDREI